MSPMRQPPCTVCTVRPVAMTRVAFCFICWPGGPVTPPPCLRCGSRIGYYTSGVCERCHPAARPGVDSCLDCHAWGATRHRKWLCTGCQTWRASNPTVGPCPVCRRTLHLGNEHGACRLCYRQAAMLRPRGGELDLAGANQYGRQLFLADTFQCRTRRRSTAPPAPDEPTPPAGPGRHVQQVLFTIPRDLAAHGRRGLHLRADPAWAAELDRHARILAAELGWSARQTEDTHYGLRIVLGIQDTPRGPVRASDVNLLADIDLPVWTVLRVLSRAGILLEDRPPALDTWFARQIVDLPEPMAGELRTWFEVMKNGSPTPPRRRPRSERTVNLHATWALPTLHAWAAAGHTSLREITREHVLDALPASGNPRSQAGQGLKSIFRLLKARRVLFTDPTSGVKTGDHASAEPLPADVDAIRGALTSTDPARAAVVALIAFHGLRTGPLRRLRLTDVRDGRAHVDGRVIVLAEPVRERITAYLDYRNRRWPNSTNPHLFVHRRSASRAEPVGQRWVWLTVGPGLSPARIREDRILNEAHATGGDPRRLADLFGLSIDASTRYTATVDHPALTEPAAGARPGAGGRGRTWC
jgi:hypothetical protein